MQLVEAVARETGESPETIMFLRHSNTEVKKLKKHEVSMEEYTYLQETDDRYDFFNPKKLPHIAVVVVIVNDKVHDVFRIVGIEKEGVLSGLASPVYASYLKAKREESELSKYYRKFSIAPLASIYRGCPVRGWAKRERTAVQRSGDGFFNDIEIDINSEHELYTVVDTSFRNLVDESLVDDPIARLKRLEVAKRKPASTLITSRVFARNPDVVAERLFRASGICERCGEKAPFETPKGKPYLEVHHIDRLADDGDDTVENTIAICPNCHRELHYGVNRDLKKYGAKLLVL